MNHFGVVRTLTEREYYDGLSQKRRDFVELRHGAKVQIYCHFPADSIWRSHFSTIAKLQGLVLLPFSTEIAAKF